MRLNSADFHSVPAGTLRSDSQSRRIAALLREPSCPSRWSPFAGPAELSAL